jgi:hypothetical protein
MEAGVKPLDFHAKQLILDAERRVYLVDAEGYASVSPEPTKP